MHAIHPLLFTFQPGYGTQLPCTSRLWMISKVCILCKGPQAELEGCWENQGMRIGTDSMLKKRTDASDYSNTDVQVLVDGQTSKSGNHRCLEGTKSMQPTYGAISLFRYCPLKWSVLTIWRENRSLQGCLRGSRGQTPKPLQFHQREIINAVTCKAHATLCSWNHEIHHKYPTKTKVLS